MGGLLTALLLVVIGQTWQTGDDAASLLFGLSAILTPWLLVIRRPLIFTLWYAALAIGLGLKGFERFGEAPDIFTPMLLAAVFASTAAVALGLSLRLRPSPGLRASALLPALNFSVLLGLLPPVAFALDNAGLESLAGLALLFLAGALIGSAALWSSRLPELRALAMLTLVGWGNALLILFMHPYLGHLSSASLGYALTLLNGLVCLAGTLSAARFSRRRTMHAKAQDAPHGPTRILKNPAKLLIRSEPLWKKPRRQPHRLRLAFSARSRLRWRYRRSSCSMSAPFSLRFSFWSSV